MPKSLDFERPVAELEGKIEELRHLSDDGEINIADEVAKLQAKADRPQFSGYASRVSRCAFPVRDWRRTGVRSQSRLTNRGISRINCEVRANYLMRIESLSTAKFANLKT